MTKVYYTPSTDLADDMPKFTSQFGYDFEAGKPTEVDRPEVAKKLSGNPFFRTESYDELVAKKPKDNPHAINLPPPAETGLKAEHHGGGKFNITRGEEVLAKGLSKSEADAFNAMSDADKEAYAEAEAAATGNE